MKEPTGWVLDAGTQHQRFIFGPQYAPSMGGRIAEPLYDSAAIAAAIAAERERCAALEAERDEWQRIASAYSPAKELAASLLQAKDARRTAAADAKELRKERDALAARLAEIERAEPAAWIEHELQGTGQRYLHFERRPRTLRDDVVAPVWIALIARPSPA